MSEHYFSRSFWVTGKFEGAEAEQDYFDRQKQEKPQREEKQRRIGEQRADIVVLAFLILKSM